MGSRTDASHSIAFNPLIPPITCSTFQKLLSTLRRRGVRISHLHIADDSLTVLCFLSLRFSIVHGTINYHELLTSCLRRACLTGMTSSSTSRIV